jgi:micrococcal nuclease
MKRYITFLLLFSFSIFIASSNSNNGKRIPFALKEQDVKGRIIGIVDGDTYDILVGGNKTVRIRMEGIDAPEKGMPFYKVSKQYLADLCFGKYVRLEINDTDSRGRKIAFTYLDNGKELSHEMIKAGLAWHFKKYNNDADLANLEVQARAARVGLWIDHSPMPPWKNRELHRKGISTKDMFDIKEGQQ